MNHLIYQSVVFVNMVEVVFVLTIFTNQIQTNEFNLTKQATTDALTGISNRHFFFESGNRLLGAAHHAHQPFSVVLLDLDDFKNINDQYGHFMGDRCLVEVSQKVQRICREQDLFARIGGEEFIIAMPDTTLHEAEMLAEGIRSEIADHRITMDGQSTFRCTASIGVASKTTDEDLLQDLLIDADKALYFAKGKGKNLVHLYDKTLELASSAQ